MLRSKIAKCQDLLVALVVEIRLLRLAIMTFSMPIRTAVSPPHYVQRPICINVMPLATVNHRVHDVYARRHSLRQGQGRSGPKPHPPGGKSGSMQRDPWILMLWRLCTAQLSHMSSNIVT